MPGGYDEQAMEDRYIPDGHRTHLMGRIYPPVSRIFPWDMLNVHGTSTIHLRCFQHSTYHLFLSPRLLLTACVLKNVIK